MHIPRVWLLTSMLTSNCVKGIFFFFQSFLPRRLKFSVKQSYPFSSSFSSLIKIPRLFFFFYLQRCKSTIVLSLLKVRSINFNWKENWDRKIKYFFSSSSYFRLDLWEPGKIIKFIKIDYLSDFFFFFQFL